jgi:hypothetical protein
VPMIGVYSTSGTFRDPHHFGSALARTLMAIEGAPETPMFRANTADLTHEIASPAVSNVDGDGGYICLWVVTEAGPSTTERRSLWSASSLTSWPRQQKRSPFLRGPESISPTPLAEAGAKDSRTSPVARPSPDRSGIAHHCIEPLFVQQENNRPNGVYIVSSRLLETPLIRARRGCTVHK